MKLKLNLVWVVFALGILNVDAQSKGVEWRSFSSWDSVLAKAKDEKKPIFLDLYATWCNPCKWMDKEVYSVDSLAEYFNREFVSLKIQMDSLEWDSPKIKGWYASASKIKTEYNVRAFPTLIILSPSGEIFRKIEGARDATSLLMEAKAALDPKNQFSVLMKQYENGKRGGDFVRQLVRLADGLGDKINARKIAQAYIGELTVEQKLDKDNIWFIYDFTKRSTDPGFTFLKDFQKEIENTDERLGTKYTDSKVRFIIRFEAIEPYRKDNNGKANMKIIYEKIKPFGDVGVRTLEWLMPDIIFNDELVEFLESNPNWSSIQKRIQTYRLARKGTLRLYANVLNHYRYLFLSKKMSDINILMSSATFYFNQPDAEMEGGLEHLANEYAWMAFEKFNKRSDLKEALLWSARALKDRPLDAAIYDTYANLLYKLGRVNDALTWQQKAINLDPNNKEIAENYAKMKGRSKTWQD